MDDFIRVRALDPKTSFIVQAPAGSGKTSLLVQRFLSLLVTVERSENIVAVTFTRKAAQEMRNRVIMALRQAEQQSEPPSEPYARCTWELARAALLQDRAQNWQLLNNPHQLQMMTIDSLCSTLLQRMPILSLQGGAVKIAEKPLKLYQKAAEHLLASLETESPVGEALRRLAQHCDNNLDRIHELFCDLLQKRDQWLSMVVQAKQTEHIRGYLEDNLKTVEQLAIDALEQLFPYSLSEIQHQLALEGEPDWPAVAELLLTQSDEWRKTVTQKQGFAAPSAARNKEEKAALTDRKQAWQSFSEACQRIDGLRPLLAQVRILPPITYTDDQWQVLSALFTLLPTLVAELRLCFIAEQEVDFLELSLNVTTALGALDDTSDLALSLDYQIRHILIDEFQDTSATQYMLFQKLVSEWQPHEGRTLFLVGDPMQSIYRFRGAEVGLFLQVQQEGLGPVHCESLTLTQNFRSSPAVVEWVNEMGQALMPTRSDLSMGAIAFSPATAIRTDEGAVTCYAAEDVESEGAFIAQKIMVLKKESPDYTIAVLGRSRRHLEPTIRALKSANIRFVGQDLDTLAQNTLIQDLLTLLEAMLNPSHRLSWLCLLRTPWFGLSLADCTHWVIVADKNHEGNLWEAIKSSYPLLHRWMEQRQIGSLVDWIRTLWLALGGPAPYPNPNSQAPDLFFQALTGHLWEHFNFQEFKADLLEGFDNPPPEYGAVQLMTIHKAKGLEFDAVFLPGLALRTGSDVAQLMLWLDYPSHHGVDWLLAPIRAYEEECDPIYHYLASLERLKAHHETGRLLYVAVTRAQKQAFLTMTLTSSEEGWKKPAIDSFAGLLWESLKVQTIAPMTIEEGSITDPLAFVKQWPRLPKDWQLPEPIEEAIDLNTPITIDAENAEWQKQGYAHNALEVLEEQSAFGTCIHRMLEIMASVGLPEWIERFAGYTVSDWGRFLVGFGVIQPQYANILNTWVSGLKDDERLGWILAPHREAQSEWVLYDSQKGQKYIIDRSFIDDSGTRWIIDYKTGDLEDHQEQIQTYVNLVGRFENNRYPMKAALYYPLTKNWIVLS